MPSLKKKTLASHLSLHLESISWESLFQFPTQMPTKKDSGEEEPLPLPSHFPLIPTGNPLPGSENGGYSQSRLRIKQVIWTRKFWYGPADYSEKGRKIFQTPLVVYCLVQRPIASATRKQNIFISCFYCGLTWYSVTDDFFPLYSLIDCTSLIRLGCPEEEWKPVVTLFTVASVVSAEQGCCCCCCYCC